MNSFSEQIGFWYDQNKRDLPWRRTKDPYKIWLSEIILQQTRVDQGLSYYVKFVKAFPTVSDLANADEDYVLRLWQGLGYYSRARNLHFAAKTVVSDFDGVFPENYKDIISLKGIGAYSAAAISSFAFNLSHAVLDGNVYRVLSRYFNDSTIINSTQGPKIFQAYADELLDRKNPARHNQAIMEFGAIVCTPKKPSCETCVLANSCLAKSSGTVLDLPKKEKKVKIKDIYLNYLVFKDGLNTYVQQRSENDIWAKMYEFPLVQFESKDEHDNFQPEGFKVEKRVEQKTHKLSHRNVHSVFWEIKGRPKKSSLKKVKIDDLDDLAKSRLIDLYFDVSFLFV